MVKGKSIQLYKNIAQFEQQARQQLFAVANTTLLKTNFHSGRIIVGYEQQAVSIATFANETLNKLYQKIASNYKMYFPEKQILKIINHLKSIIENIKMNGASPLMLNQSCDADKINKI